MESLQNIFMSFVSIFPGLLEVGICGYYFLRSRSADAVLLVIGSGIHLLTSLFYSLIIPVFLREGGYPASEVTFLYTLGSIFGLIGTVAFLIGLFLLIQKTLVQKETSKPW